MSGRGYLWDFRVAVLLALGFSVHGDVAHV
jgi:hypothetical protein